MMGHQNPNDQEPALQRFLAANGWSTIAEGARACGLAYNMVHQRLTDLGWTPEQAFEFESRLLLETAASRYLTDDDKAFLADSLCRTISDLARLHKRRPSAVLAALKDGKSLREAIRNPFEIIVLGKRFRTRDDAFERFGIDPSAFYKWSKRHGQMNPANQEWAKAFEAYLKTRGIKGRKDGAPLPEPIMLWGWRFSSWTAAWDYWMRDAPRGYRYSIHETLAMLRRGRIAPEFVFTPSREFWQLEMKQVAPDGRRVSPGGNPIPGPVGERLEGYVDTFAPIGHKARQEWEAAKRRP